MVNFLHSGSRMPISTEAPALPIVGVGTRTPGRRARRFVPGRVSGLVPGLVSAAFGFALSLVAAGAAHAQPPVAEDTTHAPLVILGATPLPAPRLAGYLQLREVAQRGVGLSAYLNRVRFSIEGALPSRLSYRLLTEWQASAGSRAPATPSLREAVLRWSPSPFTLTAGEFKTPFTREYLIPVPALELADLSVAIDSLAPRYDVGVMAEYAYGATATIALGVFNGEGANSTANRDSSVLWVGRATLRPLAQWSLGASATRDRGDTLRWAVDASVQHRGAVVRAEYLTRHVRGRARVADEFGWYVFESARIVPRVQLLARQEEFQRPLFGTSRRVRGLAWGANYDIAPGRARLLIEFTRRMSGRSQSHTEALLAQIQGQF